jgi:hypothetical protein
MCPSRVLARVALFLTCCGLSACGGSGTDKKADETGKPSLASWAEVKEGMSLKEVEALLGQGTDTSCPQGKGLPLGAYVARDGDAKWIQTTYRKWQVGDKTLVVGFFEDNVQVKTELEPRNGTETRDKP